MTQHGNMLLMVFKLIDRGLSGDQIEKAMTQLVGSDWREVNADAWLERLKGRGFVSENDSTLTIDDLEALVKGRIRLEELGKAIP